MRANKASAIPGNWGCDEESAQLCAQSRAQIFRTCLALNPITLMGMIFTCMCPLVLVPKDEP
jgi:hypothetical protein